MLTDILAARINDAAGKHEKGLEMQSSMMTFVRQSDCASMTFNGMILAAAIALAGLATMTSSARAFPGA